MAFDKRALIIAALGIGLLTHPSFAQTIADTAPPVRSFIDENGVDIVSGQYSFSLEPIQIGSDVAGLRDERTVRGGSYLDDMMGYFDPNLPNAVIGGVSIKFDKAADGSFTPKEKNGYSLSGSQFSYTLIAPDGTRYIFGGPSGTVGNAVGFGITSVIYPSGKKLDYYYRTDAIPGRQETASRLQSILSNTGYHLKFMYLLDTMADSSSVPRWKHAMMATVRNQLADPCSTSINSCPDAFTKKYPLFSIGKIDPQASHYSDSDDNTTYFTLNSFNKISGVKLPSNALNNLVIGYDGSYYGGQYVVSSVTINTGVSTLNQNSVTNYTFSESAGIRTIVATRTVPVGSNTTNTTTKKFKINIAKEQVISYIDEFERETKYEYEPGPYLTKETFPELNYNVYQYDGRGNLKSTTRYPKPGSPLAPTIVSAVFPDACPNPVTCNKPESTKDANGGVTNYTYDPVHGGVTIVTAPPPTANAVRPQTRYTYVQLDANGAPSTSGTYVVQTISLCRTQTVCAGTSDETRTTYAYGRNLLPTMVTVAAGDGSVSSVSAFTYDDVGNVIAVDGPLPGAEDVTRMRYNYSRRMTAMLTPDPDATGALKPRIQRITYGPFKTPAKVEIGTATGLTDNEISAMAVLQTGDFTYDLTGKTVKEAFSADGTLYAVTQYSYDVFGRLDCTAVRTNASSLGSLPADPCTASAGAGIDRITRVKKYDKADRVLEVTSGYGTADAAVEKTAYTNNGAIESVTDANGNVTGYVYDGLDRLLKTSYPVGSFEQLGYDPVGNVTSRRLRDGNSIGYVYDALNRLTTLTPPSAPAVYGADDSTIAYTYDNLGHIVRAAKNGVNQTAFTWDALGRKTGESNYYYALTARYDEAGRRIRSTWNDGFYVTYDYDKVDEMTAIYENGGLALARFGYDDLGRRVSLTRGNGAVTRYGYDAALRLSSLGQDVAGTALDLDLGFVYNAAGQITSRTSSNDAYAWRRAANVNRAYGVNALNQYTSSGSVTPGYDARGNLTAAGGLAYRYTSRNRLWEASGATVLNADSLDRLDYVSAEGVLLAHDGANLVSEVNYNGSVGAIARRYVFGPGVDEPLVWYEGAGTNDRRYLHADERGSIVAVTDNGGTALAINSYDEHGIPGGNVGRFQYTGQIWLASLGMYDYKARTYSPTLGRFLQTDPIGYQAGLNWYAYAGSDPVNATDPTGLQTAPADTNAPADNGYIVVTGINLGAISRSIASLADIHRLFVERTILASKTSEVAERGKQGSILEQRRKKMSQKERDKARTEDAKICDMVNTRACWESAAERDAARAVGKEPPPLQTGVKGGWSSRGLTLGVGGLGIAGGAVCAIVEPCGAAAAAVIGIGGTAALLAN